MRLLKTDSTAAVLGSIYTFHVPRHKKAKVFVSYSRHDEALVRPLAGLLGVAAEDAVFLDIEQLKPGDLWESKIIGAVEDSSVFVLCWCCQSKKSAFVAKEIRTALADGKKKLVPVLFCATKLPPELANRQWIDLRGCVVHVCEHAPVQEEPKTGGTTRQSTKGSGSNDTASNNSSLGWSESHSRRNAESQARQAEAQRTQRDAAINARREAAHSSRMRQQASAQYQRSRQSKEYSRVPPMLPPNQMKSTSSFSMTFKVILLTVSGLLAYDLLRANGLFSRHLRVAGLVAVGSFCVLLLFITVIILHFWSQTLRSTRARREEDQVEAVANRARSYFENLRQDKPAQP